MNALLLYLLKVNGALLLFAALYYVGLRRLTFYTLNRGFLLFALFFAALYPVLEVPAIFAPQQRLGGSLLTILPKWSGAVAASMPPLSWLDALVAVYWAGVVVMSLRLLGRLFSLYRLHRTSVPDEVGEVAVRRLPDTGSPFSFGGIIYLNSDHYPAAELPAILHHEQVHVRQWHTLDVLLAQVSQVLCWFNPAAWWLGRAIQENLEFITDQAVLRAGLVGPKAYQYSLLRLSGLAPGAALANHFTVLTLRNRIAMMNKPSSARAQLVKYTLVLPLAAALLLGFTTSRAELPATSLPTKLEYYLDGEPATQAVVDKLNNTPEAIASVHVLKGEAAQALTKDAAVAGVIVATTKRNERLPAVLALNAKIAGLLPRGTGQTIGEGGAQ
jgi:hypothetical protein